MSKFHFITRWHIDAPVSEVYEIIHDASRLKEWWPSVYLDVKTLKQGDKLGIGKVVELYTKGYLPYTLRWSFEVTEVIPNEQLSLRAFGDLNGSGTWTFTSDGIMSVVIYDWDIHFDKPYLSKLTWLLGPVFKLNHEWAMRKGFESLMLELKRRKGDQNVPLAPKPVWYFG